MGEAGNTFGEGSSNFKTRFPPSMFYREMLYIQVLLHREGPSHRDGFTQRDDFITGCFYLQIFLRGDAFNTGIRAHTGA